MKILFVTSSYPFPPHTGGQKRSFYLLKHLASKGSVTLLSAANPNLYTNHTSELGKYCENVIFANPCKDWLLGARHSPFNLHARFTKLVKGIPWILEDYVTEEIYGKLMQSRPEQFDLIVTRYLVMAYFFLTDPKLRPLLPRVVVDVDDVHTIQMERELQCMKWGYRKLRTALDFLFLKVHFRKLWDTSACLAVSENDRQYLLRKGYAKKAFLVPNMIEVNGRNLKAPETVSHPEILFGGMLSYPPNQDALLYFCGQIFPKIRAKVPTAKLTITGRHAPEKIVQLGKLPGIEYVGYVPSMEPYYERTSIVICPLLNGAGTRIKILDAMAHKRPVVSTTIGAEGLEAVDGKHLLIADDPETFAAKCTELLTDPEKRRVMAARAYEFVKENYDVSVFERKIDEALKDNFHGETKIQEEGRAEGPLVSVILPTYNRASYLKKAIASVCAQSFQDWELIVVDDGSTDETGEVLEGLCRLESRMTCLYQFNGGAASARNKGLNRAKGKYVAFLDDDDEWLPEKLKTQVEFMEAHPEIGMSYTRFKIVCSTGPKTGQWRVFPEMLATTFEGMIESFFIPTPTVMMRRSCLGEMLWFDSQFRIAQDQDLWFRFGLHWKVAVLDQALTVTYMDDRPHAAKDRICAHQYMIKVLSNLRRTAGSRPFHSLIRRRKAQLQYAIARDLLDKDGHWQAARYFATALMTDPLVGLNVRRQGEEGLSLLLRLLKAYLAIPICLVKGLIHGQR